jgi:Bacterial Ig-like domain (group 2)
MFKCRCKEQLDRIEERIAFNEQLLSFIIRSVLGLAIRATLAIEGVSTMPATIQIGGKGATAVFTELNAQGGSVAPITAPAFTSSDPTIATVDPASGAVAAVAVGTATISATDAGNGLTASDTVTVTPAPAVSATLVVTAN